jgi:hypothetical protein
MRKHNERLRLQFQKLENELIMPFLEQTKTQLEKNKVASEIWHCSEAGCETIGIDIFRDENGETTVPFSIDCDLKSAFNIFTKPVYISSVPCQPMRKFPIKKITKDFLSEWMSAFIKGMKITETMSGAKNEQ